MKYFFFIFSFLTMLISYSQSPDKMSYQAIIRNANNEIANNQLIGMKISILENAPSGQEIYSETHLAESNEFGLISLVIGEGSSSDDFSAINWSSSIHFLKTETDPEGGTNYVITGTTQLLSVPYALFSKKAGDFDETDPIFKLSTASGITESDTISWNNKLDNFIETDPVFEQSTASDITESDIATWNTVNLLKEQLEALENRVNQLEIAAIEKVEDIDGNMYVIGKIGDQYWFLENLKTIRLNDGTPIPLVTTDMEWSSQSSSAYCWPMNDQDSFKDVYGAYYNWHAVNTNKLCPTGWSVATENDWNEMISFLGGGDVAGGKLKSTSLWADPNEGATDEVNFSLLSGGERQNTGFFSSFGEYVLLWSATEVDSENAYSFSIDAYSASINRNNTTKVNGFSCRCVKKD